MLAESQPLVSICIPTYNRASMIGKAIESALDQTYKNLEVIVVDNASTDNTDAVVNSYSDNRLRLVKNERNLGLFGNFNRCIELAHGKYLHILHSDDYIEPDFTRSCVDFLETNPGVGMTFTSVQAISDKNQIMVGTGDTSKIFSAPEGFRKILTSRNLINCPTVIVRKDVYDAVGLYSLEYPYASDLYQWLRIAKQFDIAYIAGPTLFYYQGQHSESFRLLFKAPVGYIDTMKIFIRVVDELGAERRSFASELNCAFKRHIRDCLFAGIARSKAMTHYSCLIFIGFALSTWGLIQPVSLSDYVKKTTDLLLICIIGGIIILPGGRYCLKKILRFNQEKY